MTDFSKLFIESKGQPIMWNEKTIIMSDKFPVTNKDTLIISIEKTNSPSNRQGLYIDITGSCECDGELFKQGKGIRMLFWEDTAPQQVKLKIFTKESFVIVKNIWENINYLGKKSVDYGHNGAAMIIEEIENGRRYRCNDWHPDDNFDDIVFTVQKVQAQPI